MLQEKGKDNRNWHRWQTKMYGYQPRLELEAIVEEVEVEVEVEVEEVTASVAKENLKNVLTEYEYLSIIL